MNRTVALVAFVFIVAGVVYVLLTASRTFAGKRFFKELQTAYHERQISFEDYRQISELFIYTDGFSYSHQAHLEKLLREAKERKKNG